MNGYELSRAWFNFSFENPEKIRPIHTAIFCFAIEHWNRLGQKDKFGFPSQMTMEAIGVKNYQTYGSALSDLIEWGFIVMIEKSRNQYSANIITLSATPKNSIATSKASIKALDKANLKHCSSKHQSTVSIIEPLTIEPKNQELINVQFEQFWNLYNKKVEKVKCEPKFKKLSEKDRQAILEHVPKYVKATPDSQYRKNPFTYLNARTWEDEHLPPKPQAQTAPIQNQSTSNKIPIG